MKLFTKVSTSLANNTYILVNGAEAIIIDPSGRGKYLIEIMQKEGAALKAILLTHGHFDHIMAVDSLLAAYQAPVYLHDADKKALLDDSPHVKYYFHREYAFIPDKSVSDGQTLTIGSFTFKVIHTPGHTPGSVCYLMNDMMFTGDTLFSDTVGRWDFPFGDHAALSKSVDKLLTMDDNIMIYPGHGPAARLGQAHAARFSL